jgi:hypothetical protein
MGSLAGAEQSSEAGHPSASVQAPKPPSPTTPPDDEELDVVPDEELDVMPEDDPVWDPDDDPDPEPPELLPLPLPVLAVPEHAAMPQAIKPSA